MGCTASGLMEQVVSGGNCAGCGGCVLFGTNVQLELANCGYLRPITNSAVVDETRFRAICPGVGISEPPASAGQCHPIFGNYVAVWQACASNEQIRYLGSSGGVITALSVWALQTGRAPAVVQASQDPKEPTRTCPVLSEDPGEVIKNAGSRYAPVSTISILATAPPGSLVVCKPCEAAALAAMRRQGLEVATNSGPVVSFFCAGTPSQTATDTLVDSLAHGIQASSIRYRGEGWPGVFRVKLSTGDSAETSYAKAWGLALGRALQPRCKICVDGTGEFADIAVGDYWDTDSKGYPDFDDRPGRCVVIARTQYGADLVQAAAREGWLELKEVDLTAVANIQPLHVARRITLLGRLMGWTLAGHHPPRYSGWGLLRHLIAHPWRSLRAAVGMFIRSR